MRIFIAARPDHPSLKATRILLHSADHVIIPTPDPDSVDLAIILTPTDKPYLGQLTPIMDKEIPVWIFSPNLQHALPPITATFIITDPVTLLQHIPLVQQYIDEAKHEPNETPEPPAA